MRKENGGLSSARMAGVAATSAPYVFPLDADDAVIPGTIAALADALDGAPDAALAWGDIQVWGEVEAELAVARSLDPWLLTYLNDIPVASLLRRTALEDAGGWSMGSGYEDWDLWLALAERGYAGIHVHRADAPIPTAERPDARRLHSRARRAVREAPAATSGAFRRARSEPASLDGAPAHKARLPDSSRPSRSTRSRVTASICS